MGMVVMVSAMAARRSGGYGRHDFGHQDGTADGMLGATAHAEKATGGDGDDREGGGGKRLRHLDAEPGAGSCLGGKLVPQDPAE
jgi:hypothetical protein